MQYLKEFINSKKLLETEVVKNSKLNIDEARVLQYMTSEFIEGNNEISIRIILDKLFHKNILDSIKYVKIFQGLLDDGWIVENSIFSDSLKETSLEILNMNISLSQTFLKLLEFGNISTDLPQALPYLDHIEYLKDEFLRIDLIYKLSQVKINNAKTSNSNLKYKLKLLEERIKERLDISKINNEILSLFKEFNLDEKEQIILLAILKDEYNNDEELRDMNVLLSLISNDEYERMRNRFLLDEQSKLVSKMLIDFDEIQSPFFGITRNYYIQEDILRRLNYIEKSKKQEKIKLNNLIKDQEIFEFIEPKTDLKDAILHPKTQEMLEVLLKQVNPKVINRLKQWGIKDKKRGIDAKIIFYGTPGTGKTFTALSLAKSLKKSVLSLDCSKILSMYIGESEKNVRKIFDIYKDLSHKSKTEPVLLLNEADQFLSSRTTSSFSGAEKMHNQMQNIFLEQIEQFDGILIATTNLLENLDLAFSRRFNYKIEIKRQYLKKI